MPPVSENQRRAAGMALAAKRGDTSPDKLKGPAKDMYDGMNEQQLRDFAKKAYWSDLHARYPWLKAAGVDADLAEVESGIDEIDRKMKNRKSKKGKMKKKSEKAEAPDYRMAGESKERCGNCEHYEKGSCIQYDFPSESTYVCDTFAANPEKVQEEPKGGRALAEEMEKMPVPTEEGPPAQPAPAPAAGSVAPGMAPPATDPMTADPMQHTQQQKMAFVAGFVKKCEDLGLQSNKVRSMIVVGSRWPGDIGTVFQKVSAVAGVADQQGGGTTPNTGIAIAPQPKPLPAPAMGKPTAGQALASAPAPGEVAGATQPQTMPKTSEKNPISPSERADLQGSVNSYKTGKGGKYYPKAYGKPTSSPKAGPKSMKELGTQVAKVGQHDTFEQAMSNSKDPKPVDRSVLRDQMKPIPTKPMNIKMRTLPWKADSKYEAPVHAVMKYKTGTGTTSPVKSKPLGQLKSKPLGQQVMGRRALQKLLPLTGQFAKAGTNTPAVGGGNTPAAKPKAKDQAAKTMEIRSKPGLKTPELGTTQPAQDISAASK